MAAAIAFLLPAVSLAQPQQEPEAPPLDPVPNVILSGAITGSEEGLELLDTYLRQGDGSPDEVARRARQVLLQLRGADAAPEEIARAAVRAAQLAASALSSASMLSVGVESGFVPPSDVIALDFGSPDAPPAEGFERVTTTDPRVKVTPNGQAIRRPGLGTVLDDGIAGLESFVIQVPNGTYRLVLLTDHLGDPEFTTIGSGVVVNDVPVGVRHGAEFGGQLDAVLASDGLGVVQGARLFQGERGRGIVIEVVVTDGQLRVSLPPGTGERTRNFITGALIEPVTRPSVIAVHPRAESSFARLNDIYRLETEVAQAVAETLSDVLPGADQTQLLKTLQLPKPQFENPRVPSPS
jgi:hypothetical protein